MNPNDYNVPQNPTAARRFRLNRLLTMPFYVQLRCMRLQTPKEARRLRLDRLLTKPLYLQLRSIRLQHHNQVAHTDIFDVEPANHQNYNQAEHTDILDVEPANHHNYNAPENPTEARRFRLARLL
ncbi:hypothetical protein MKW98_002932, partial [Papaver atlanticum]